MHAQIARARFQPEHADDVIRTARESTDAYRELDGFVHVTHLFDRTSGWGFTLSTWETEANAKAAVVPLASVTDRFAPYWAEHSSAEPGFFDVVGALPTFEVVAEG